MSTFLRMLWSGRDRKPPRELVERIEACTRLTPPSEPPHRNVEATPQRPPVESLADYDLRRMAEKDEMLLRAWKEHPSA